MCHGSCSAVSSLGLQLIPVTPGCKRLAWPQHSTAVNLRALVCLQLYQQHKEQRGRVRGMKVSEGSMGFGPRAPFWLLPGVTNAGWVSLLFRSL